MRLLHPMLHAAALVALGSPSTAAQATYDACYVPSVGAVYLIKQAGLPTTCLALTHVPFTWTSGGALADGSVTIPKLAFDPATQAELDVVIAGLVAAGTINAASNPMDWTRLKNVPPGLADGVDDGGGPAADVVCAGCVAATDLANSAVTTAKIADAAVTAAKLSFDPGRVSGYEIIIVQGLVSAGQRGSLSATCPVGKAAVGGGYTGQLLNLESSLPFYGAGGSGSGWAVDLYNVRQSDLSAAVYVVCVNTL